MKFITLIINWFINLKKKLISFDPYYQKIKDILSTIGYILLFSLGMFFFSLTVYNRLIRVRESVDIIYEYELWKALLYSYIIAINLMFLIGIIIEVCLRKGIINKNKPRTYSSPWYRVVTDFIRNILKIPGKAWETFYLGSIKKIPRINDFYHLWGNYVFTKYPDIIPQILAFFILLCPFIVVNALFIDVFIFEKFHWFYKCLFLLIIPWLIRLLLYGLEDYNQEGITVLDQYIHRVYDEKNNQWIYHCINDDYFRDQQEFDRVIETHAYLHLMINIIKMTRYYTSNWYIAQIINSYRSSMHIITWGYLLFSIL